MAPLIAALVFSIPLAGHADPAPSFASAPPALSDMEHGMTAVSNQLSPDAKKAAEDGIAAMGRNNFAVAETNFLKLLKLSPDNINGLINLGLVEFRLGRSEEAQKYLQQATHLKPDAGLAWMMLGVIFMNQHDQEAATAALAQAVYLNPRSAEAHNYFAVTLARRGWYSGAEDEMEKVVELAPKFADAHFNLAVLYLQETPPAVELARRHYQKALELGARPDPDIAAKLAAAPVQTTLP